MNNKKYGLIFDMDGIIADTEALNASAAIRVFAECFGLSGVKREDFEAGIGRGAEAYMRAAGAANGLTMSETDVARAVDARQTILLKMLVEEPLPPFPGVLELMHAALSASTWSVAIATGSTQEKTDAVLKAACIPAEQMIVITGSEPHARKPAPDMFLAASQRLNLSPSACVVIEDSPSGVEAAKAAGCKCIAVTNSFEPSKLIKADRIVDSLTEVPFESLTQLLHS